MDWCREVKLRLSLKRTAVLGEEGPLPWSHLISRGSQSAVLDAKRVQWFIGFVNLSRLMPCLSEVWETQRELLKEYVQWHWLTKHDTAMEIKVLVTAVPVLRYHDINKPVTIQSDSRKTGLGYRKSSHSSLMCSDPMSKDCLSVMWFANDSTTTYREEKFNSRDWPPSIGVHP